MPNFMPEYQRTSSLLTILHLQRRLGQINNGYGAFIKKKEGNGRQILECMNNHIRKKLGKVYKSILINVESFLF